MSAAALDPVTPAAGQPPASRHPWLAAFVEAIDSRLRRHYAVVEYTRSPDCIFRMSVAHSDRAITLSDGTDVHPHDRVIDLHLWNDHIPAIPEGGATLAWARQLSRVLGMSLRELNAYLTTRPDLDDITCIRAIMALTSADHGDHVLRLSQRYGFEPGPPPVPPSMFEHLHRFGENILISLMVLAHNQEALRLDTLRRARTEAYLPRTVLQRRCAEAHDAAWGKCENRGGAA